MMDSKNYLETKPLADGSDLEDGDDSDDQYQAEDRRTRLSKSSRKFYIILITLLIGFSSCSGLLGFYLGHRTRDLKSTCAEYTAQYSPVLSEANINYSVVKFNGTFMRESIYRQAGSPEVDAAWNALGVNYRAGVISKEEGLRSGLTSAHVQRSEKYGGGFFVNVEGLHHLHCLDLLRKSLYFNYPYYKALGTHAFKNDDHILQLHVSHCVDMLRQILQCNADTGVLGQVWYDRKEPQAFPDFNTNHKCKNFDAIRQWGKKREEPPVESLPPDYLRMPTPDDVLEEVP